jgi:hypothetical protein
LTTQSWAKTFRTPPDISLPMVMPPQRPLNSQLSTTMFWLGRPTRRPSRSRPDLIGMQSSLVSNRHPVTCTSVQESGSNPSPWELVLRNVTPRTVTFVQ